MIDTFLLKVIRQFFLIGDLNTSGVNRETLKLLKELHASNYELKSEVDWLKKTIIEGNYSNKFDEVREKILQDIEKDVSDQALKKAKQEVENSQDISDELIKEKFEELIEKRIVEFDFTKYVEDVRRKLAFEEKTQRERELDGFVEVQLRSGGFLRTVLINLFIIVNISIIVFLFIQSGTGFSKEILTFISAIYLSLSLFIVYIYRSSNLRTKALMALKEDSKKFYDAIYYLDVFANNENLSKEHEKIISSILINRLENETIASHPYEKIADQIIKKLPTK